MAVTRRKFILAIAFFVLLILILPLSFILISARASQRVTVKQVEVTLPNMPPELDGLTIAHLSDLHYGFGLYTNIRAVEDVTALVRALNAELIVFTGDLLDHTADPQLSETSILKGLHAPLGVYAVLGNHDHAFERSTLRNTLSADGIRLLVNESIRLTRNGRSFWLVGLDDPLVGEPKLAEAMSSIPSEDFVLLLVHTPDFADRSAEHNLPLQLSGHSHCGQIRLPGIGPLWLPPLGKKYPSGLRPVSSGKTYVYTNCGLGTSGVPFRLFCPPEIAFITLRVTSRQGA
ncbi:metallophosphoesterase [Hydrogenibacillus schlegelii]|uniref:metallophosphoesterase n=1 Tax=Hydrogenibacillus schlegelii TaxID=1484 RepID=UPI00147115F0